jgi:ferredoxin
MVSAGAGPVQASYPVEVPKLSFLPSGRRISVRKGARLVDAIRRAGLPVARACGEELVCAKCGVRVLSGQITRESAREREVKRRNRIPPGLRLACAIRVHEDLVVTADYWGPVEG